jgi:hypothetical protein
MYPNQRNVEGRWKKYLHTRARIEIDIDGRMYYNVN